MIKILKSKKKFIKEIKFIIQNIKNMVNLLNKMESSFKVNQKKKISTDKFYYINT